MKINIILPMILLLTSCGNPHTYSSGRDLEQSNSALETDKNCTYEKVGNGYQFFYESEERFTKCKSIVRENFNGFQTGPHLSLSNDQKETLSYTLRHQVERATAGDKVEYLSDLFDSTALPIMVKSKVGFDQGIITGSGQNDRKSALVWSFRNKISYFVIKAVDLKNKAKLRLFNCDQELIIEQEIKSNEKGSLTFGFVSDESEVCHISLSARRINSPVSLDDFSYGNLAL